MYSITKQHEKDTTVKLKRLIFLQLFHFGVFILKQSIRNTLNNFYLFFIYSLKDIYCTNIVVCDTIIYYLAHPKTFKCAKTILKEVDHIKF